MKKKTFERIKIISVILGVVHVSGYIWFGDYYLSEFSLSTLFKVSTGIALIVMPLISDALLKISLIRLLTIVLGTTAIINICYMVIQALTLHHLSDILVEVLKLLIILLVIIVMFQRVVRKNIEDGKGEGSIK